MVYAVNLTARAQRDLVWLCEAIDAAESDAALKWYRKLRRAILSREESPNRCPVTPESAKYRHLLYGRKPHVYRVIYRVSERQKRVDIVHIRHGARRAFAKSAMLADEIAEAASRGEDISGYFNNLFAVVRPMTATVAR